MTTPLDMMTKGVDGASTYVYELERKLGKKPTAQLREMLKDAYLAGFMAGAKASPSREQAAIDELLRGFKGFGR